MKSHYADYVAHVMRGYYKYEAPVTQRRADEVNWKCADITLGEFTEEQRHLLRGFYTSDDAVSQTTWSLVKRFEKRFAMRRGLI